MTSQRAYALHLQAALVVAVLVITASSAWCGPVLLTLTRTHGVHLGDVLALGLATAIVVTAGRAPQLQGV